jgi:hypothetical protein
LFCGRVALSHKTSNGKDVHLMALLKHGAYRNQTPFRLYILSNYFKILEST